MHREHDAGQSTVRFTGFACVNMTCLELAPSLNIAFHGHSSSVLGTDLEVSSSYFGLCLANLFNTLEISHDKLISISSLFPPILVLLRSIFLTLYTINYRNLLLTSLELLLFDSYLFPIMHSGLLKLAASSALLFSFTVAEELAASDVPSTCKTICGPMVSLSNTCSISTSTKPTAQETILETRCICTNNSFDVENIGALCASCIGQNGATTDSETSTSS